MGLSDLDRHCAGMDDSRLDPTTAPAALLPEAAEALQQAGWKEVYAHVMKGTAHGIAPDGLSVALAFVRDKCGF